jgi:hypothetical protein
LSIEVVGGVDLRLNVLATAYQRHWPAPSLIASIPNSAQGSRPSKFVVLDPHGKLAACPSRLALDGADISGHGSEPGTQYGLEAGGDAECVSAKLAA